MAKDFWSMNLNYSLLKIISDLEWFLGPELGIISSS